jgi:2-dehydro-3-deoxyglucarate aldolase/4-hydroxy-2-oxoheptanedioate aldolase
MKAFQTLPSTKTPLGTWLMAGAPNTAEALGHAGFDFLVVDMEHVTIEFSDLAHIMRAIGCTPSVPVVRLAWADQVLVKRAMDAGAETLMLPFIQTAEQAREAVSYMRYPPYGVRGVAAVHRGSHFGTMPGYLAGAHERAYSILQLETPEAVANLDSIAAVEGVDAIFVGPGDLSAAMGHIGDIGHAEVQELLAHAAKAAAKAGKPVGIVGPNPTMVRRFLDYGYSFAAVASDMGMMTGRAGEWLAELRQAQAPAATQAAY